MTVIERIAESVVTKIQSEVAQGRKVKVGDLLDIEVCLCPEAKRSILKWPVLAVHIQEARERSTQTRLAA